MPRSYGRIATSIWRDADFRALAPHAKLTYAMLVTQAEISPAGLLDITSKRWINQTGLSSAELADSLTELEKYRFIVTDDDTEELLVRSFVKWDGGAANDLRRRAIGHAAAAVQSPMLAATLAGELDKQGVPHSLSDRASQALSNSPSDSPSIGHQNTVANPDTAEPNSPSDRASDTRRVVVTEVELIPNPQPSTLSRGPEPITDAPHEGAPRPNEFCSKHPTGTDEACRACGRARTEYETWDTQQRTLDAKARDQRIRAAQDAAINEDLQRGHAPRSVFEQAKADAEAALATRRANRPPHPEPPPAAVDKTDLTQALAAAIARRQGADA